MRPAAPGDPNTYGHPVIPSKKLLDSRKPAALAGRLLLAPFLQSAPKLLQQGALFLTIRFTGVSRPRDTSRSPTGPPRTGLTPFPRRRNSLPGLRFGGNFELHASIEGRHLELSPERRVGETNGHLTIQMAAVTLEQSGCWRTAICTKRSPVGPPAGPASPSPLRRMRSPVSTPGGTLTDRVLVFSTSP